MNIQLKKIEHRNLFICVNENVIGLGLNFTSQQDGNNK